MMTNPPNLDEAVGRLTEDYAALSRRLSSMASFLRADAREEAKRASRKGADVTMCQARQSLFSEDAAALDQAVALLSALVEMRGANERLKVLLEEAAEVLDRYSDASQEPGDSHPHPNAAMRMMCEINEELGL